jgi:hypothetical protein
MGKHRLKVYESSLLRSIFGPKEKIANVELYDLYC